MYSSVDFVCNLYLRPRLDGPLVWIAHLLNRTYVTNIRQPTAVQQASKAEAQRELGMYLGKTLNAVYNALAIPDGVLQDGVVATVWLPYQVTRYVPDLCEEQLMSL